MKDVTHVGLLLSTGHWVPRLTLLPLSVGHIEHTASNAAYIKASKQQKFMKCVCVASPSCDDDIGADKKCYELTQKVQCG